MLEGNAHAGTQSPPSISMGAETSADKTNNSKMAADSVERERKEVLYKKIRNQISFYMSDSNLCFDVFMRKVTGLDVADHVEPQSSDQDELAFAMEMGDNGSDDTSSTSAAVPPSSADADDQLGMKVVPLSIFIKFRKISRLTENEDDVVDAFRTMDPADLPTNLVYLEEQHAVRRRLPFTCFRAEVNDRSIYVEDLPTYIDHLELWIHKAFAKFGPILSTRIHCFAHNRKPSGFAFVEFSSAQAAAKAIHYLDNLRKFFALHPSTPKPFGPLNPNLTVDFHDLIRLHVIPKNRWISFKNQYLNLQKKNRADFKRQRCYGNTDENAGEACPSYYDDDVADELCYINDFVDIEEDQAEDDNEATRMTGNVVSLAFIVNAASPMDNKQLRRQFKAILSKGNAVMPPASEVFYVDVTHTDPIFISEGNRLLKHQTIYLRVASTEAAQKFVTNAVGSIFEQELFDIPCKTAMARVLSDKEVTAYWNTVNTKRREKDRAASTAAAILAVTNGNTIGYGRSSRKHLRPG